MPRRFSTQQRAEFYKQLLERDGDCCQLCDTPAHETPQAYGLQVDHIDHDTSNNDLSNLRLLCRSCNIGENNKYRSIVYRRHTADALNGVGNGVGNGASAAVIPGVAGPVSSGGGS